MFLADDTSLQRKVALKFLPQAVAEDAEARDRFLVEAQAAAALSHPNLCVIHEVGETERRLFIAMEYVEGETLQEKIRGGALGSEEILSIMTQVAAGLEEAHAKGIIHRDIKSGNVMVTANGQAKIMDFELAKVQGRLVRSLVTARAQEDNALAAQLPGPALSLPTAPTPSLPKPEAAPPEPPDTAPSGPAGGAPEGSKLPLSTRRNPPHLQFLTRPVRLGSTSLTASGDRRTLLLPSMGQAVNTHSTHTPAAKGVTASVRSFRRPGSSVGALWVGVGYRFSAVRPGDLPALAFSAG